jgi:hypothetical protein
MRQSTLLLRNQFFEASTDSLLLYLVGFSSSFCPFFDLAQEDDERNLQLRAMHIWTTINQLELDSIDYLVQQIGLDICCCTLLKRLFLCDDGKRSGGISGHGGQQH